jgi:ketosteroid isomerase-like protein
MNRCLVASTWPTLLVFAVSACAAHAQAPPALERIRVDDDGSGFVLATSGERFVVWGVNYDHDADGRLLEDYWHDEWPTVVEDFREIKDLGANTVRIHLQLGKFMDAADQPSESNLARLAELLKLAEHTGLYLYVTGLGCYHRADIPAWYDKLAEADRWRVQQRFWQAVANVCQASPAVFCYDLMNEPILAGAQPETDWLAGDFGGKHFVQRITLDLAGRTRIDVAKAWVQELTSAIRQVDQHTLLTVGVIPWAHVFPGAKPLFYAPQVGGPLDFTSVHFYPKRGEVAKALDALRVYDVGKPLVVAEIFPLHCSLEEAAEFIDASRPFTAGLISFYWGQTIKELQQSGELQHAIMAKWLQYFASHAKLLAEKDGARVMTPDEFIRSYERALRQQDWAAVEPLIHADACVTFSDGTVHEGRPAVAAAFSRNFSLIENEEYTVSDVRWLRTADDHAVCLFGYSWRGTINNRPASGAGRGTAVIVLHDGKWQLLSEQLTALPTTSR